MDESVQIDIEKLEAEGDLAADYIEGLLDLADLDGDMDLEVRNNRSYVSISGGGNDLDVLAGSHEVQALQTLSRLAVQRQTGEFSRLILDIAGSREARATQLKEMVDHAVASIVAGKEEVTLESMSSYERKIVHDYVAEKGYFSESRGEGQARRLVISSLQ